MIGYRRIGGRFQEVTPGQAAGLDVSAAEARALTREVQRHDPTWRPTPSIYEGVEGQILANRSEAQHARIRLRELARELEIRPLVDVVLPNGRMIGTRERGAGPGARTVSPDEFRALLEAVSPGAVQVPSSSRYEGQWYQRPDGSIFGVRRSEENGMTFDVIRSNHPSIESGYKVHKK
jgi:hypothetical protein